MCIRDSKEGFRYEVGALYQSHHGYNVLRDYSKGSFNLYRGDYPSGGPLYANKIWPVDSPIGVVEKAPKKDKHIHGAVDSDE